MPREFAKQCQYIAKGDVAVGQKIPYFSGEELKWKQLLGEEAARWRIKQISSLPETLYSHWAVAELRLQLAVEHLRLGEVEQAKRVLANCAPSANKTIVSKLLKAIMINRGMIKPVAKKPVAED